MPKPKKAENTAVGNNGSETGSRKNGTDGEIKIKVSKSSIAEFTERNVPTAQEVDKFEELLNANPFATDSDKKESEERVEEIDESLNEIYQDDKGGMVNVRQLDIKRKHGFLFWLLAPLIVISSLAGAAYLAYKYFYLQPGSDATAMEFSIAGETEVVAGEEFFYTISYRNSSNVPVKDARVAVAYPVNFIVLDSFPASAENDAWPLDDLPAKFTGTIKIKGMIIAPMDDTSFISANLTYMPENFSSEFKKEATLTTTVRDLGVNFDYDYIKSVLVGDDNELKIKFRKKDQGYIDAFRLSIEPQENMEIISGDKAKKPDNIASYTNVRPGVWEVRNILTEEQVLPVHLKFKEKKADIHDLKLVFEYAYNQDPTGSSSLGKSYIFNTETLSFEVMKSDLNLTLIINGSREDQGVDFGQALHYSIVYNNKGETDMKEVVIMVVLESEFLDPQSLVDPLKGKKKSNTISWSKAEIPELELLAKNEEGTIDFSINVAKQGAIDMGKAYEVKSYAQYSIGDKEETATTSDNRSNTIVNRINSDLKLGEQIRYFSVDNIPVGTGPHPPKVGETTSYKVYWNLTNTLHELNDLTVTVTLPEYVFYDAKNQASAGTIGYNDETRLVSWNVGRLPITVSDASAEFSIKITPTAGDRNKIMVLLPGSMVKAIDDETKAELSQTTKAETTRLDDDDIAVGDGIVD